MHLLVRYPPRSPWSTPSRASRHASCARSTALMSARICGHFWSPSYFATSCQGAPLSTIKEYIENQKRPGQRPGVRNPGRKRFLPGVNARGSSLDHAEILPSAAHT
ncbi:IS200/IS605 family transposase [Microtetraspora malaysiensis]|uniref:IS200/IS605 family transposase n=1 Tax=Microtetraspora malaysiensis TaxID=161358 RepID=UPI003D942DF9